MGFSNIERIWIKGDGILGISCGLLEAVEVEEALAAVRVERGVVITERDCCSVALECRLEVAQPKRRVCLLLFDVRSLVQRGLCFAFPAASAARSRPPPPWTAPPPPAGLALNQ